MNKKAFTLIELLVVVLIIGILAAVALPQYNVAVLKTRLATTQSVVADLAQSAELYYLANNEYPADIDLLDLSDVSGCQRIDANNLLCGKIRYNYQASSHAFINGYIMSEESIDDSKRVLGYRKYLTHSEADPNALQCIAFSDQAHKVCKSYGGRLRTGTATYDL